MVKASILVFSFCLSDSLPPVPSDHFFMLIRQRKLEVAVSGQLRITEKKTKKLYKLRCKKRRYNQWLTKINF